MGILKEGLIIGILLPGLLNSLYGVPFVGAYSLSGARPALYWTLLFLLGNFSAYLLLLVLWLYPGANWLDLLGKLKLLMALLISLTSLLTGGFILLTALTLNKFLLNIRESMFLSGGMIYLFGLFLGLYLGESAGGMGIYLSETLGVSKPIFALCSFLFALGSFISPLYIIAGLFRFFHRDARTQWERRVCDVWASILLVFTGLGFLFWG